MTIRTRRVKSKKLSLPTDVSYWFYADPVGTKFDFELLRIVLDILDSCNVEYTVEYDLE